MDSNSQPQPDQPHDDDAGNLVDPKDACPNCGERHVDHLVWTDDDIVRCTSCGNEYDPRAPTPTPTPQPEGGDDASA